MRTLKLSHHHFYLSFLFFSWHSEVSFLIVFNETGDCNTVNEFNEGVEFSIRLLSRPEEWIPIKFIYHRDSRNTSSIYIGNKEDFHLRGFSVQTLQIDVGPDRASLMNVTVEICNFSSSDSFQFRWLQTSHYVRNDVKQKDIFMLNYFEIELVTSDGNSFVLLNESFDNDTMK